MNYIKISNDTYPVSLQQIKNENLNTAFPSNPTDEQLVPYDHANVFPTEKPSFNAQLEKVLEITPGNDGSQYNQTWQIVELSTAEVDIRIQNAKATKSTEVYTEYQQIEFTLYEEDNSELKNKRKHDLNLQWNKISSKDETNQSTEEKADVVTMNDLTDYTSTLNSERDTNLTNINALTTEQEVLDYVIVYSAIPEGLPGGPGPANGVSRINYFITHGYFKCK